MREKNTFLPAPGIGLQLGIVNEMVAKNSPSKIGPFVAALRGYLFLRENG